MDNMQKDILRQNSEESSETSEGKQDEYRGIISQKLQEFFVVNSVKDLIEKFNKEMSREEKSLVQTAIQSDRPINTVEVLDVEQEVYVDNGRARIKYNMPAGALVIKYGKRKEDGADLTVYVYRSNDDRVRFKVLGQKIDLKKENDSNIVSPSNPDVIRGNQSSQSPPGASSPLPESDKREW
jgi:hypothetical protein